MKMAGGQDYTKIRCDTVTSSGDDDEKEPMPKIKLTKGELKRQRDALRQYERYLPTLQLKKQQLQLEIVHQRIKLNETQEHAAHKRAAIAQWAGVLADPGVSIRQWVSPPHTITAEKNVAGVDLAVFERVEFPKARYDLFVMPLWVDTAIDELRALVSLQEEIRIVEEGIAVLREELRITTQRVNLFEKVKIPEAREAIRLIKIFLGDQMTNAIGRSKIAKDKIQQLQEQEAAYV